MRIWPYTEKRKLDREFPGIWEIIKNPGFPEKEKHQIWPIIKLISKIFCEIESQHRKKKIQFLFFESKSFRNVPFMNVHNYMCYIVFEPN